MEDVNMALFGFWFILSVMSLLLPPSQCKEVSALHCRFLAKYCMNYFRGNLAVCAHQPEVLYSLGQNGGSGFLQHCNEIAVY